MEEKIKTLFEYRKLPELLSYGPYDFESDLVKRLIDLQISIYELDAYLESNWKTKKSELTNRWKRIYQALSNLGIPKVKHNSYLAHLMKYQDHELAMRAGKLPNSLSLEYYYFYKSCDVKLIRKIIYDFIPNLKKEVRLSDWREFDLITEINDDVEDVYEDVDIVNGNYFQFDVFQKGKIETLNKFEKYLLALETKAKVRKNNNEERNLQSSLYKWTVAYGKATRRLLKNRIKEIELSKILPKNTPLNFA